MNSRSARGVLICSLAALFYVYDYFVQVSPSVMVASLMQDFRIGAEQLGLMSACFFYSYAVMQMPAGWMLDRWGARRLLSIAVLISALGVGLFGVADQFFWACVGRFLIGLGSAFAFISTLYLIANWFAHRYFAGLAGLVQLGACLGSIAGLMPVAWAVNHYGWRDTMTSTAVATGVLAVVFYLVIRDRPDTSLETASQHTPMPSSGYNFFRMPQLWVICWIGLLSWVPVGGLGALWGVPYLMQVYHLSNVDAGGLMAWFWLGLGVGSPLVGVVSNWLSLRKWPIICCFTSGVLAGGLLIMAPSLSIIWIRLALVMLGISASIQSLSFGVLKDVVAPHQFGVASGMNNMAAIVGGGTAQPLIGFVLSHVWDGRYAHGVPLYTVHDYQLSLYMLPAIAIVGVLVTVFGLRETHCR